MADLKHWREVAERATPGPWAFDTTLEVNAGEEDPNVPDRWWTWELSADEEAMLGGVEVDEPIRNLRFITTFDPSTVKAMLDVIELAKHAADDSDPDLAAMDQLRIALDALGVEQ